MKTLLFRLAAITAVVAVAACESSKEPAPPAPSAAFTSRGPFVVGDSTRFVNSSSDADTYLWNFGDGATSTAAAPAHAYQQPGTFTVTLQASNRSHAAPAQASLAVTIAATPPAGYSCLCKVTSQNWVGGSFSPRVRLPDERVVLGFYGPTGFVFKNIRYVLETPSGAATYFSYHSDPFTGSMGGLAAFYAATDSVIVKYHSGGLSGGTDLVHRCRKL